MASFCCRVAKISTYPLDILSVLCNRRARRVQQVIKVCSSTGSHSRSNDIGTENETETESSSANIHFDSNVNTSHNNNDKRMQQSKYNTNVLENWFYVVETFGRLKMETPFNVRVESLDPQKYLDMDKVIIRLLYDGEDAGAISAVDMATLSRLYTLKTVVEKKKNVSVNAEFTTAVKVPVLCQLQVPVKFDVEIIATQTGGVVIQDLENSRVDVALERGDCYLENIKTGHLRVQSAAGGNITSGSVLQGNVSLQTTGLGKIDAHRVQGTKVNCQTEAGEVTVKAVYAETSHFVTKTGDITLGSCHGQSEMTIIQGNIDIGAMDGSLEATVDQGSVSVYAARHERININSNKGDITLQFPDTAESSLELVGSTVSWEDSSLTMDSVEQTACDGQMKVTGILKKDSGNHARAVTRSGSVQLSRQDWLGSLRLQMDKPSP